MRARWFGVVAGLSVAGLLGACSSEPDAEPDPTPWQCSPTPPSPESPFAAARDPSSARIQQADAIASRFMAEHPANSLAWDWEEGVFLAALADLYRVTGDTRYRDYLQAFLEDNLGSYLITVSDRCPPALTAIALYRESCDERYRQVIDDVLHYLDEEAARTEQGGISHMGTVPIFQPTLWVDSLFMFGEVFVRWGELSGSASSLDAYSEQYRIFAELLQEEPGWFKHAYGWEVPQDPGLYWARGNSWIVMSAPDYLRVRAERGESDAFVLESYRRLASAVVGTQDASTGLWWTLPSHPGEIYLETSASALFAAGLARGYRVGALDASVLPVIEKAMQGVQSRIVDDGSGRPLVTGISGPTTVGGYQSYADVPLENDLSYGVGAVLFALIETSGLQ